MASELRSALNGITRNELIDILILLGYDESTLDSYRLYDLFNFLNEYMNESSENMNRVSKLIEEIQPTISERKNKNKVERKNKVDRNKEIENFRKEYLNLLEPEVVIPINIMQSNNIIASSTAVISDIKRKHRDLYIIIDEPIEFKVKIGFNKYSNVLIYNNTKFKLIARNYFSEYTNKSDYLGWYISFNVDSWINDIEASQITQQYLENFNITHPSKIVSSYIV